MSDFRLFRTRLSRSVRVSCFACLFLGATTASAQFVFTTFDVPGSAATHPYAINNNGDIAGNYLNSSGKQSGFIRTADGTFTLFDLSPIGAELFQVSGINDLDQVSGTGLIASLAPPLNAVGFVRDQLGDLTTFAATVVPDGSSVTAVAGLNNLGESIVQFVSGSESPLFALRTSSNSFSTLPPPPTDNAEFTPYTGLNNNGEAVGDYPLPDDSGQTDGFILNLTSLAFTSFDLSTGAYGGFVKNWTTAVSLNDSGIALGTYLDGVPDLGPPLTGNFQNVDYLRAANGSLLEAFVPPFPSQSPRGVNDSGEIVGEYTDALGTHAFIGMPSTPTVSPVVSVLQIIPGPPEQVVFSVVDPVSGISGLITAQNNCAVTIAPYTPGQTTPVKVIATKTNQTTKAIIGIQAWSITGNLTDFDPAFVTIYGSAGPPTDQLSAIPRSESILTITNGAIGLDRLSITVNGKTLSVPLVANEKRTINLKRWMTLVNNTIEIAGEGRDNSLAAVVLRDASGGRSTVASGRALPWQLHE